jgi:hypothetical protein
MRTGGPEIRPHRLLGYDPYIGPRTARGWNPDIGSRSSRPHRGGLNVVGDGQIVRYVDRPPLPTGDDDRSGVNDEP